MCGAPDTMHCRLVDRFDMVVLGQFLQLVVVCQHGVRHARLPLCILVNKFWFCEMWLMCACKAEAVHNYSTLLEGTHLDIP